MAASRSNALTRPVLLVKRELEAQHLRISFPPDVSVVLQTCEQTITSTKPNGEISRELTAQACAPGRARFACPMDANIREAQATRTRG